MNPSTRASSKLETWWNNAATLFRCTVLSYCAVFFHRAVLSILTLLSLIAILLASFNSQAAEESSDGPAADVALSESRAITIQLPDVEAEVALESSAEGEEIATEEKGASEAPAPELTRAEGTVEGAQTQGASGGAALPSGPTKSGVTPQAISLPSGSGTIQGMEESFSTQLSTGVATFSVPFALSAARGKAQAELGLSYSSAGGLGTAGVGWDIGVASIARQTDRGTPGYADLADWHPEQDRFVFNGGGELVPICTVAAGVCAGALPDEVMPPWADGWQYFRARVEGQFLRFFWAPDHRTWVVQSKAGVTMELGVPLDGSGYDQALEVDPDAPSSIYRWSLVRKYDTQGLSGSSLAMFEPVNVVQYRYFLDGNRSYLTDIYDTPPAASAAAAELTEYAHHVRLLYEVRTDPSVTYRSGFRVDQKLRLRRVDVASKPFTLAAASPRQLVRRYHLRYDQDFRASLLLGVQLEGRCSGGVEAAVPSDPARQCAESCEIAPSTTCPRLPEMQFEYSHVADGQTFEGFEEFNETVSELANAPGFSVDAELVDLFDINSDALPDIVVTAPALFDGEHGLFLNGGAGPNGTGFRQETLGLVSGSANPAVDANVLTLGNLNVAPLDSDGDGRIDLIHMPRVKNYEVFSPEHVDDQWVWLGRGIETASAQDPKIDFTQDSFNTKVVDVNFDGLVDIVVSTGTELQTFFALGRYPGGDGQFGHATRTSATTAELHNEPVTSCVPWSASPIRFGDPDVFLADMNGDGITDIGRVRPNDVRYWPGRGNGFWGTGKRDDCPAGGFGQDRHIEMTNPPTYEVVQGESLLVSDANGDGLADIVEVRFNNVDIYLNTHGEGWTPRRILRDTPPKAPSHERVRLVDVDGSGTEDVLWGDGYSYRYIDLQGGTQPALLTTVHNGLGASTTIEYAPSTAEMLRAAADGEPWQSTMPLVTQVVSRVLRTPNVAVAGAAPQTYITEYQYRDPVYEGRQREFRGFSHTEVTQLGDDNSPTSSSASYFLLGECEDESDDAEDQCSVPNRWRDNPREALKGLPFISETFDENGVFLSTTHSRYDLRRLYSGRDGREVRYAFQSGTRSFLYDTAPFTPANPSGAETGEQCSGASPGPSCLETVRLELDPESGAVADTRHAVRRRSTAGTAEIFAESRVDFFGNQLRGIAHGRINTLPPDEVITTTSVPDRPLGDPTGWLWRNVRSSVSGADHGDIERNVQITVYDANGNPTESSSELAGTVELQRDEPELAVSSPARSGGITARQVVPLSATSYDEFGNPVRQRGANLRCADVSYDSEFQQLPIQETIFTRGCDAGTQLTTTAEYDRGFALVTGAVDIQGQTSHVDYDGFGRLLRLFAPRPESAASPNEPSLEVEYFLPPTSGPFYSYVHTKVQDGATVDSTETLESWAIIDGLGRTITTLAEDSEVEVVGDQGTELAQRWIVGAMQEWDQKGALRKKFLEFYFTGDPQDFDFSESPLTYYGRQRYDAFGRQLQTFDLDGTITLQSRYHALSSDAWDAADLEPGSHTGTPLSSSSDGHGRTQQVIERFHAGNVVEQRITETEYLPTGEPEIIRRRRSSTGQEVTRWFAYDTMGRMVLNVEPNTSAAYNLNTAPNASEDNTLHDGIEAWRYRYNDAGELIGTSDARGCGANFFYDGAGRLLGEDYFPCLPHHAQYTAPAVDIAVTAAPFSTVDRLPATDGNAQGFEVSYLYDAYSPPSGSAATYGECNPEPSSSGTPAQWFQGRLVRVQDQAAQTYSRYDGRGRVACVATRVAVPHEVFRAAGGEVLPFSARYAPRWYGMNYSYDAADRVVAETTGADVLKHNGASSVFTQYGTRGVVEKITSNYDFGGSADLIGAIGRTADNLVTFVEYGDLARTATSYTYDDRRRVHTALTARAPPASWSPEPSPGGTFQMVLQDEQYFYDAVNNPIEIRDNRIEEEWPAGAKPVIKKIQYDDLYRAKRIDYQYTAGDDAWVSPHAADTEEAGDTRRAQPSPHVSFAKRILWQTYQYDWLGNNIQTGDDADGFYDRSLGTIENGTANDGPYQLRGAAQGSDTLDASYDVTGNLETLFVQRSGTCLPAGSSCSQSFIYQWDELGRLTHAKRWDGGMQVTDFGEAGAEADLKYIYAAGDQRVIKTATDGEGDSVHTVYIYPSLELRRTAFNDGGSGDYTQDGATEVAYLFANGVRLARLVNEPDQSDPDPAIVGALRVFFELGDHLGSTSVALDKATSELVERATYQAYGGAESDYRPGRWGDFREDYRFTGKEEDVEVGLTYFGKRFYNAALQRWASADPLEVHAGGADPNLYAYVSGAALRSVDPIGLDPFTSDDARAVGTASNGGAKMSDGTTMAPGEGANFTPKDPGVDARHPPLPPESPPAPGQLEAEANFRHMQDVESHREISELAQHYRSLSAAGGLMPLTGPAQFGYQLRVVPVPRLRLELPKSTLQRATLTPNVNPSPAQLPSARGAKGVGGSMRNVNPKGGTTNCANCAVAADATLAGRPASARAGQVTTAAQLAREMGSQWIPTSGPDGITTIMQNAGPGARGIVFGSRKASVGHFFNVVNQGGTIRFVDGQAGGKADLSAGYDRFFLMRTN